MPLRIGINGFGRMGRLALRAGWDRADLSFVHINEIASDPAGAAHLLTFDSVHGKWDRDVEARDRAIEIDGRPTRYVVIPAKRSLTSLRDVALAGVLLSLSDSNTSRSA